MAREAALVLEDGTTAIGVPFGADAPAEGEVVFTTGMTGYQEVATDPSYRGQLVVMTQPQIGNYGVAADWAESVRPWVAAIVARELAAHPHHWEGQETFPAYLARWGVPGLQGIDTRALVRRLREQGTLRGVLRQSGERGFTANDIQALRDEARQVPSVSQLELVSEVSAVLPSAGGGEPAGGGVAVLDCGTKWNIVRSLEQRGIRPRVFAWDTPASEILAARPKAIVVSNGPGDPERLSGVVNEIKTLVQSGTPMLGICLGHQLIALAAGGQTKRLPYGHHGGNHPVREVATGRVTITSQNHEFYVDGASIDPASGFEISHVNLNDGSVEGLRHRDLPVRTVQFHPEGAPGPQDSQNIFDDLLVSAGLTSRIPNPQSPIPSSGGGA